MVNDYVARAAKTGKSLGFRDVREFELEPGTRKNEAERLLNRAAGTKIIRLDERGTPLRSVDLSKLLTKWRDEGEDVSFLIGGADGLDPCVEGQSDKSICFGVQTWPHKLVRVMIAEQIYRALSIAANAPYHRE